MRLRPEPLRRAVLKLDGEEANGNESFLFLLSCAGSHGSFLRSFKPEGR
jgi:hypothetical protein